MKNLFFIVLFSTILFAKDYKVDQESSSITFQATKFLFVDVDGEFSDFSGSISVEDGMIKKIDGVLKVSSINTNNTDRDSDLKSNSYFDNGVFPNIVFESQSIDKDMVEAKVIIKGLEKNIKFMLQGVNISDDMVSFKLSSQVDRADFKLDKGFMISNSIDVFANIVANSGMN